MIIEQDESLTEWIKERIVKICDAEPVAFAKYVLALLKKDSSEEKLRDICEEQLNVFLGTNTKEFVDSLFDAINSRSYVKDTVASDTKQESVTSSKQSAAKSESDSQSKSDSGRTQRRRISPPHVANKDDTRQRDVRRRHSRSRSPHQRRRYGSRYRASRSRSRSPRRDHHRRERSDRNIVSSDAPSSRKRCHDFEEKGVCRRGDNCPYDHGTDPIVLDGKNADNFQTKFGSNPPPPGVDVSNGGAPEAYNPEAPSIGGNAPVATKIPSFNFSVPPPPLPGQVYMNQMNGMVPMNPYMQPQNLQQIPQQGGFMRGFGRGRGRGRYGHFSERVQPNKSSTIEVRRIPPEVNKLGIIHKHFEQFGDITNIQISFDGSPDTALVTYAKLPDAQSAIKSEKAILDNRFIQVSWHRPPPPKAPEPQFAPKTEQDANLANVKPVIPLMPEPNATSDHIPTSQLPQAQAVRRVQQLAEERLQARRKERQMSVHLQKIYMLKSQLFEKQSNELKGLFTRITKATDPKVKAQLATIAKKLDESLKGLTTEIHELRDQMQKTAKKGDLDGKSPKKRRLSSTNSESGIDIKKSTDGSKSDTELNSTAHSEPADEQTIRKLLSAQSSDEESDGEEQQAEVKLEANDEDELLGSAA